MKFKKFSLKVSLKYFNEIFTRQNFMKFSISNGRPNAREDILCLTSSDEKRMDGRMDVEFAGALIPLSQ